MAAVAPLGVTKTQFSSTYAKTVGAVPGQYDYNVDRQAELLAVETRQPTSVFVTALRTVIADTNAYIYPDVDNFINWLKGIESKIIILTWGNPEWNREKITHSRVAAMVDDIICTAQEKVSIQLPFAADNSEVVFINDNPKEVKALTKLYPKAQHIRLQRPDGKYAATASAAGITTFASLSEIQSFLQSKQQ